MKKIFLYVVLALAFMVPAFASGNVEQDGTGTLVVLHTNDFHGHPVSFFDYPSPGVGGLPAISTLVRQVRGEYDNVLVLDAGDFNTGRPESNFFDSMPDVIGYNYVGYDALTLGNHEFDKPLHVLEAQREMATHVFLSANVLSPTGEYIVDPYYIKDFGDLRVGVFGLTTTETPIVTSPNITGDLIFKDEVETAREMVEILEDQVDVIIALTHLGLYNTNESGSRRVAANVEGIDLIVDGHSHTYMEEAVVENGTPIVQAKHWGLYVGKAVLTVADGEVTDFDWKPMPVNLKNRDKDGNFTFQDVEIPEDPFLLSVLEPYVAHVETLLSEEIGTALNPFLFETDPYPHVRLWETPLGNIVTDSMAWFTKDLGVDFALQNGGGIRAALPEGAISKRMIYETLPFDNSVMVLDMTGAQIIEMFDFVPTIQRGKGGFPQVSSEVNVTVDFVAGEIKELSISGKPVDPNATYKVATNSFLAAGGDGYSMMPEASYIYDTSAFQRDVLIDYIQALDGELRAETDGRLVVIE